MRFDARELGDLALRLLRISSPTGHEEALADCVEAWALRHFSRAEVLRISQSLVLGHLDDERPSVALVGHLDTVPGHEGDGDPRIEGDRLIGLGASDMKGALAVMMALGQTLERQALPLNPVWVFYESEEGPFEASGLKVLLNEVPQLRALTFAIAMEPTDGVVQVGCVGSLHATLTFRGQAAHSARPWQGTNAIHAAAGVLADLAARERREVTVGGHSFFEVMSATMAQGGRARNVIPDVFELNVNSRFAPGKSVAEAQRELLDVVRGRCDVTFRDAAPAGNVSASNAQATRLIALSGHAAQAKQAWTDVARFSEVGVDAVNFGPGETTQAHQRGESASLGAMGNVYEILWKLLAQTR